MTPADYLRCKLATSATDPGDSGCLEQATSSYPFDGELWHRLASARLARNDLEGARQAFEHAYALGVSRFPEEDAAELARIAARTGDSAGACRWLGVAIWDLHDRDPDGLAGEPVFDSIRKGGKCATLGSREPAPAHRDRAGDIRYFVDNVMRYRPDLAPKDQAVLKAAARELSARAPGESLDEFAVELQHLHALVGRGHSGSPAMWDEKGLGTRGLAVLPVDFYLFPEGLFIIGEQGADTSLVGAKVLAFDGVAAGTAIERVASLIDRDPGSEMSVMWLGPRFLGYPAVLKVLGLSSSAEQAVLRLRLRDGSERNVTLAAGPFRPRPKLYAPATAPHGTVPLYLRRVSEPIWSTPLGQGTLYVQFNQVADSRAETLSKFALELRAQLSTGSIRDLIVDLRHNNGGDTYLYPELLRTLIAFDTGEGHRIFVISGRNTFSAAENFLVDVRRLTHALFAGEPASAPRAGGDEVTFRLPASGLPAGTAPVLWSLQSPADTRVWIAPDLPVALTAADYFANRDPVLDTIEGIIAKGVADGHAAGH